MAGKQITSKDKERGARIQSILETVSGGNRAGFGQRFDPPVTVQAIGGWIKGAYEPKGRNLDVICALGGVSADWLLYGRGEAPRQREKPKRRFMPAIVDDSEWKKQQQHIQQGGADDEDRYHPEPDLPPGFDRPVVSSVDEALGRPKNTSTILEIDVRAGAGGGGTSVAAYVIDGDGNSYSAEGVKDQWQLPDTIMRQELHASPAHIRIFEVIGDSMLPVLHERDRVFIDTRMKAPSPDGIFALWDGQGLVIKRLQMINPSDPPRVRIISANKAGYDPYEMPLSDIQIIGRFAGKFTTQLVG